jgi:hypothetical protein
MDDPSRARSAQRGDELANFLLEVRREWNVERPGPIPNVPEVSGPIAHRGAKRHQVRADLNAVGVEQPLTLPGWFNFDGNEATLPSLVHLEEVVRLAAKAEIVIAQNESGADADIGSDQLGVSVRAKVEACATTQCVQHERDRDRAGQRNQCEDD